MRKGWLIGRIIAIDAIPFCSACGSRDAAPVSTPAAGPAPAKAAIPYADARPILEPSPDSERFDPIVATNVLVYYDAFDQALALANIARMLRPGGYFVTNYAVSPLLPLEPSASVVTAVFFDRQGNGDTLYCYQRR